MRKTILVAFGFMLSAGSALADTPQITRYALENGLDVVLVPDSRVPKVVTNIVYRVGALNEPAGRSGFAHLFEHLMFSGTEAYPNFDHSTAAIGITNNAWTNEDSTVYYQEGLASTLPVILSIEADRMANLGRSVAQNELDVQRAVVKNEMRQNVIDQPSMTGWEVMWAALYPKGHPYSKAVLGSLADLDAASLDDVKGFFNTFYVPNNATLVIVGDIDIAATKTMIADTLGHVARGADVPATVVAATEPTRVRIETTDRVPAPLVALTFSGPAFAAAEGGALAIAAEILGNSDYGLLRDRLVGKGLATYATAGWYPGYLGGRFLIESAANTGVDAAAIETELRAGLTDFLAKPVDPADVERAKRTLLLAARVAREPLSDATSAVSEAARMTGHPEAAFEDDPRIVNATPEQVSAVANKLLALADASTLVVKPGARGDYPALLTESTGAGAPFTATPRPATEIAKLEPGTPGAVTLPVQETAMIGAQKNIRLIHYRMPDAPMAYIAVSATGGWYNAAPGKEGVYSMAMSMATRGAGAHDFAGFAKAASDIGATLGASSDQLASEVALTVPPDAFDAGVALLAEAVLQPRFDAAEWDILRSETQDWLARREADLPDVAKRAASQVLFASTGDRPGPDWSNDSFQSITLDETRALYEQIFAPGSTTLLSVGPMTLDEVKAGLEKSALGKWDDKAAGEPKRDVPAAALPAKRRILMLPEPGASQTAIYVARAIPGRFEPGWADAKAVLRLLGADFTSRLNSVIREEKGYSYGVYGSTFDMIPKGSALAITTTVQRDASGPALQEFFNGFDSLAKVPVSQEELDRTLTAHQLGLAGIAETSGGLFQELTGMVGSGLTLEDRVGGLEAMTRLSLDTVRAEALKLAPLDQALIVVAGDPQVVMPQLKAIGITEVEVIDRTDAVSAERSLGLTGGDSGMEPVSGSGMLGSTGTVHGTGPADTH
ncbi:MAG: M16 family metallopeptidase [Rhizobiaceae bacterium]